MQEYTANYLIYNASAGSGKTYGLVKAFLKIVLAQKNAEAFRSLLAITFTNKAVFEMKNRIIEMLTVFADAKSLTQPHPMFAELCQELTLAPTELQMRAGNTLMQILHNYAALSISTIDKFNQQLIRNFAFDLKLNQFFEIQLDRDVILKRAVDNLMQRAGSDIELTDLLTEFANDKIDEDKNWDSTAELLKVAQMLTVENHFEPLAMLKDKHLEDFQKLKKNLSGKRKNSESLIKNTSLEFLQLMDEHHLDEKAFMRGSVFHFFKKLSQNPNPKTEPAWDNNWQRDIADEPLYPKAYAKANDTSVIDGLQPAIVAFFYIVKEAFINMKFYRNALQSIVPLALLNRLQNEIEIIKEEENILPIWEFNGVISNEITSQPAPFIYERIGERYRHYFIDEFQDTSVLQWKNFIPLILNAVQSEGSNHQRGSVLLVGDAKQSIYRWRGGKAEQFMSLYSGEENPFFVTGEVHDLVYNYRSLPAIIHFNNAFFDFISHKFDDRKYQKLYAESQQQYPEHKAAKNLPEGYLNIRFVDDTVPEDEPDNAPLIDGNLSPVNQNYCRALWDAVLEANRAGVKDKDICVLVRKNEQGSIVASFLTANNRKVISSESLLLDSMPSVRFVIALLRCLLRPESEERRVAMLFEYINIHTVGDVHSFIARYTKAPLADFFDFFGFSQQQFASYSLYEGAAYIIKIFDLAQSSDAYLVYFLDAVYDFKSKSRGGLAEFLDYWDDQKEKLSVSSPDGIDAISIMTVHKSKGLSAPVIILAFADSTLEGKKNEMLWYPVPESDFSGFSSLLVNHYAGIEAYENDRLGIISSYREQYLMDEINVLYVAMTRPESFLYIITRDSENLSYGTLFKEFLTQNRHWDAGLQIYNDGRLEFPPTESITLDNDTAIPYAIGNERPNYRIATRASMLWGSAREASIERGNVIHELLSRIIHRDDLETVVEDAVRNGELSEEQQLELIPILEKLLYDDTLGRYYTEPYQYYTEREFINAKGNYFRPDRIAFDPLANTAVIIDYKTGMPHENHRNQLQQYADDLTFIGWNIAHKYIVYLQDTWKIEEV